MWRILFASLSAAIIGIKKIAAKAHDAAFGGLTHFLRSLHCFLLKKLCLTF